MIAAWFASKAFQIVVIVLALLALITIPVSIIQTVRLDGVSLFGWHIVDGALAARDAAVKNLGTCQANTNTLQGAVDLQNTKIASLGEASAAAQAKAAQALADARAKGVAAAANEAQILAAKPGADLCKSADALILENVR